MTTPITEQIERVMMLPAHPFSKESPILVVSMLADDRDALIAEIERLNNQVGQQQQLVDECIVSCGSKGLLPSELPAEIELKRKRLSDQYVISMNLGKELERLRKVNLELSHRNATLRCENDELAEECSIREVNNGGHD